MDSHGYGRSSTNEDKLNLVASQHVYNEAYDQNFSSGQPIYLNIYHGKRSSNKTKYWVIGGVVFGILLIVAAVSITLLMVQDEDSTNGSTLIPIITTPFTEVTSTGTGITPSTAPSTTTSGSTTGNTQSTTPNQTPSPVPSTSTTETAPSSTSSTTTQPPGEWEEWSSWSDCSGSCGSGTWTRTRNCPVSYCKGSNIQGGTCKNKESCLDPLAAYGTWETWNPWLPCSETCGEGMQSRSRICNKDDDQEDCLGDALNHRECNNGACLVEKCEQTCEQGTLVNCTHCVCFGEEYSGSVLTESGEPISNVIISHAEVAGMDFAVTGEDGVFNLSNVCPGTPLKYHRQGFISQSEKNTRTEQNIVLTRFNRLSILRESKGGARLVGGCITLECDVTGTPGPDYYEWFKNGNMTSVTTQTLTIDNLQEDDEGLYLCRASNDAFAVYSHGYTVRVKNASDHFCQAQSPFMKNLPTGCSYKGQTAVDVGRCLKTPCSSGNDTCTEHSKSVCGVKRYARETVSCRDRDFEILIVEECGCIPFEEPTFHIHGVVVTADNLDPVRMAQVSINGTVVTETDNYGQFVLKGPIDRPKLTLTIDEPFDVYAQLVTVINLNEDDTDVQYIVLKVPERHSPVDIDSSEGITLNAGSKKFATGFAEITIPPNSLYNKNGSRYDGKANIALELYDPRDIASMESAPGDFSSIDEEGDDEMLLSTGMIRLNIRDTNGHDLNLAGRIRIAFEAPIDTSYADGVVSRTRLWTMKQDTGKWDFVSEMTLEDDYRKAITNGTVANMDLGKFYTELEGISIGDHWTNFDAISEVTCHSKIRIFNREGLWDANEITGANVGVLILDNGHNNIRGNTISTYRAFTDNGDSNGYCLIHPCDSPRNFRPPYDFKGYIGAEHKGSRQIFRPDSENRFPEELEYKLHDNTIEVKLDFTATPINGPYYDWESPKWGYSKACSDANIEENHFRFYLNALEDCVPLPFNVKDKLEPPISNENYLAWDTNDGYMFIKVLLINGDSFTKVQALSMAGKVIDDIPLKVGDEYGAREECPENRAVCLEVKVSGIVGNGHPRNMTSPGDVLTQVNITLTDISYTSLTIEPSRTLILNYGNDTTIGDHGVNLLLQNSVRYGQDYGIYYHDDEETARDACRVGNDPNFFSPVTVAMTKHNPAFTFILNQ